MLNVVEMFTSLQGEGARQGEVATFVRFHGCNLSCPWCDTPQAKVLNGFTPLPPEEVFKMVRIQAKGKLVVLTGGEPLLQNHEDLAELIMLLSRAKYQIQIETNGTIPYARKPIPYMTVSPKPPDYTIRVVPHEIKVVVDEVLTSEILERLETSYLNQAVAYILQPEWISREWALKKAIKLVEENPRWKLRLQMHKILGLT